MHKIMSDKSVESSKTMHPIKRYTSLNDAVCDIYGNSRMIHSKRNISGGDINKALLLTLDDGTNLFMKANTSGFLPCFEAEKEGLEEIRKTNTVSTPEILGLGTDGNSSFLLLEYITDAKQVRDYWETFAAELAAMHRTDVGNSYGFLHDNWIGAGKQINTYHDSWISFFLDCRLKPQLKAADSYFSAEERRQTEYLLSHLDSYLQEPDRPSLIHGDLWAGNMITGNDGKGWLIDPAVYYGHPEADLAMTELFGGFSMSFYETYRDIMKLEPGYEDRRNLYNLYHLLNHLNLFGSGYLSSVRRILKRYAG